MKKYLKDICFFCYRSCMYSRRLRPSTLFATAGTRAELSLPSSLLEICRESIDSGSSINVGGRLSSSKLRIMPALEKEIYYQALSDSFYSDSAQQNISTGKRLERRPAAHHQATSSKEQMFRPISELRHGSRKRRLFCASANQFTMVCPRTISSLPISNPSIPQTFFRRTAFLTYDVTDVTVTFEEAGVDETRRCVPQHDQKGRVHKDPETRLWIVCNGDFEPEKRRST
ncbi:hypothetical protein BDZ97DRAFT_426451 [Flammula alnicola]|nr:hypothetical protein BDZ97DRAFT_426451 [Flammula alnicola]